MTRRIHVLAATWNGPTAIDVPFYRTVGLNETNGTGIEPKGESILLTFLFIELLR